MVVVLSGSVVLLSDTIHNFGDAMSAVVDGLCALKAGCEQALPVRLWTRRRSGRRADRVHYPLQRNSSCRVRGHKNRLLNPQPVELRWAIVVASLVGFVGNEAVDAFLRHNLSQDPITAGAALEVKDLDLHLLDLDPDNYRITKLTRAVYIHRRKPS